jgi:hypothetical protein
MLRAGSDEYSKGCFAFTATELYVDLFQAALNYSHSSLEEIYGQFDPIRWRRVS